MIPIPPVSALELGPLTIHLYALCILAGIVLAVVWAERRWRAMGGDHGAILDVAVPAVLLGLVGGRLYHVVSDAQLYFGPNSPNEAWQAVAIWQGGLGIWGAVPMGALGVWLVARRRGWSMSKLSFAIAPTIPLAQAFGRWGNYFNQELFGAPTDVAWSLQVEGGRPGTVHAVGVETYHPTFLYESLWCLALAVAIAWAGRRWTDQLGGGRLFALYIMGYCVGRFWIEYLRIDPANEFLGMRLNNWTTLLVFAAALAFFLWAGSRLDRFSTQVNSPDGQAAAVAATEEGGTRGEEPAESTQGSEEAPESAVTSEAESGGDERRGSER
jgi:prolipoprotein diacylglyceryl transferase